MTKNAYYWIRRKLHKPWIRDGSQSWEWTESEIAQWDGESWSLIGEDYAWPAESAEVLSGPIERH